MDHYSILECDENSSFEDIKRKYQELALKYHPDKAMISDQVDRGNFHSINQAWNILKEPESRQKYDLEQKRLRLSEQPPIFAYLSVGELTPDKDSDEYSYQCRCGGVYTISKSDLLPPECLIGCDECSFNILVTIL